MSPEQINQAFDVFFEKMVSVSPQMVNFRTELRIAFSEGIIQAQGYIINRLK